MTQKTITTTVTRTVTVRFDQDAVRELLREKCGAPKSAIVDLESWGDASVTWSTTEDQP